MDLDEPLFPTPKESKDYLRYKRWQDRFVADGRTRLSMRVYKYGVELPLCLAWVASVWWGSGWGRPARPHLAEFNVIAVTLAVIPILVHKFFRTRP